MAILQDLLKEAFESSGNYEKAINSTLNSLQQNSIVTMNNTQYALLSKPQIYKGSVSVNSADFSPTELSLTLTNIDGTGNRLSLSSPYNSWAEGKVLSLQDQFRNMYDYLNNIDPIEVGRKLTDDEMDYLMDSVIQAKKNKTSVSIDYSGTGLNNAINFLNSDRGPININANTASTVDNSPLGKLKRLTSKNHAEKKMWINRNFVFGEDFVNNKDFRNAVLDFYSQGDLKSNLFDKLVKFEDFSPDKYYYEAYGNMFEAYKELEGLDSKGLQKKIVDEVKSWNMSEAEIQNYFDLLKDGAEHFGWQGSRDFIDYDPSLYKGKPNTTSEVQNRQRRRGNAEHRAHTAPSGPQPTGPQRGDQFYDPKRKRQYVYEGPDNTFEGMHSFISDQGRTFVGSLDDLEKFTDESRFLNIDDLSEYRSAIDELDTFLGDIHHGSKSMEDGFWDRAQKAVKRVNKAEGKVKKKIKNHRMETDSYKKKKVLQGYINDWKNKHNNTSTNTNQNQNTNTNRDTNANANIDPDLEDMDGGPDWDGGANDFDQGAFYEEEWSSGYDGADDVPFGAEDFDDEFLANLTDEQIFEQARNNEELERYIKMRDDARARLGLNNQTFNMETENRTINNNFNGVNQEHQQQQRSTQGNQEYKIDIDKPWTWTDDDIRTMADGDPDAAIDLINQREQARQQQQAQNQQRETQEETKNTAEETTGSSNQEPPEMNTSTDNSRPVNGPETRSRKQRIEDAGKRLGNNKGPNGSRKRFTGQRVANNSKRSVKKMINKRQLKSKKFRVKGDNLKEVVANTVVSKVVGKATEAAEETVQRLNPNFLNGLDDFADLTDDDIAYFADQISDRKQRKASIEKWKRNRERAKKERKNKQIIDDFENGKFDYDPENPHGNRIRHNLDEKLAEEAEEVLGSNKVDDVFGWMKKHKIGVLDVGFNLFSSIGDYKDSRRKGHGVISSAARAAGSFAVGEMLGFWGGMGVTAFKLAGTGIVKGTELLYKENRRMNSAANNSAFGAVEFQDTQQLATMRQSGMEMAKMAQYNLQQTLMGNEATYLHR